MRGGLINVIIGLVFIVGGLSGKMALRGTESGPALAAIGGVLLRIGGFRMLSSKS
ncbi:MAG: hypothetical protein ACYC61_32745 [Isosphaeraceae bacterium]